MSQGDVGLLTFALYVFLLVLDGDDASPLTAALAASGKTFDFCMSNPPFFASQSERQEKAAYKPLKMTGNPVAETDAVVEGGEVAFVTNMIEESLFTGNKIRSVLYVEPVVEFCRKFCDRIHKLCVLNHILVEFCQDMHIDVGEEIQSDCPQNPSSI